MFRMNQFIVTIVKNYLCQILIGKKNEEHLSKRVALVFLIPFLTFSNKISRNGRNTIECLLECFFPNIFFNTNDKNLILRT